MYNTFRLPPSASSASSQDTQGKELKRSKVSLACTPCRRTKTKCSGDQPCSQCVLESAACVYDGTDGRRTHKRHLQDAQSERDQLQIIFERLRDTDSLSASMLYARIRQGEPIAELVQYSDDSEVARASNNPSIEKAVVTMLSGTQIAFEGALEYVAPSTTKDLWEIPWGVDDEAKFKDETWTKVSPDLGLINHLVQVYFCWLHHHIPIFSETFFLQALKSGNPCYCSSILVNAVLSASCLYCQTPASPVLAPNVVDYRTLSDRFMKEAEVLLREELEEGSSSMTSVQALVIMAFSYVQLDENAKSKMWDCLGRASVMMQTLNLDNHLGDKLLARTDAASITFWGLLMADRLGTHICGRRGHVRTPGRPKRPIHHLTNTDDIWRALGSLSLIAPRREKFIEVATAQHELFNIIDDIQSFSYLFGAPLKIVEINSMYRRLHDWRELLPDTLHELSGAAPNLFHLMAMYHAVILRLFRPLAQAANRTFVIDPRIACEEAASSIVELETIYEEYFGLYFSTIYHLHHIFAAACTYIGNLDDLESLANFTRCLGLMQGLEARFKGPVQRAFRCMFLLLQRWGKLTLAVWEACMDTVSAPGYESSLQGILGRYSPSMTSMQDLSLEDNFVVSTDARIALEAGDYDFLFSDWLRAEIFRGDLPGNFEEDASNL